VKIPRPHWHTPAWALRIGCPITLAADLVLAWQCIGERCWQLASITLACAAVMVLFTWVAWSRVRIGEP
jgi:hypothetical protein